MRVCDMCDSMNVQQVLINGSLLDLCSKCGNKVIEYVKKQKGVVIV